jgi:pyruvate dehydrogenase E2 component (dihydrolipoamide acetyltransferase)
MPDITMPSLGADMDAATLAEWKIKPGDRVERGTIVALIETQKATMELESFATGFIEELLIAEGTKVPVGTPLARVRAPDEPHAPDLPRSPPETAEPATAGSAAAPPPRVRSSPAARKLARERAIDLRTVAPSGPHGAIVLRDVDAAAARPTPPSPPPRPLPPPAAAGPVRDAIAAAMTRSKREIPHYYLAHTISLRRAVDWLAATNAARPIADRILAGALLLRAVARALWDVPELNGFWIDGGFRPAEEVHLGTAIVLRTGGVIAPAILDADDLSVDALMAALRDLVARARAGHLRSTEMTAATITVTSLGDRGCEAVWGVINPPQVAMIGFGAIADRPWIEAGQVVVHPVVTVTLAADHRVSDGHRGGLFLHAIDRILQEAPIP